jgi:protein SCO1
MPEAALITRRRLLAAAGLAAGGVQAAAVEEPPVGWVNPRALAPALMLQCADGRQRNLRQLLGGRVTAVQLMFTGCTTSCPVQGALFAQVAGKLPPQDLQLLSISIDALGDDAKTLAQWQGRFGHHAAWAAGVPAVADVDPLASYLRGVSARAGTHTAQVFAFDRQARLVYRTGDSPRAGLVVDLLAHIAAQQG